MKNKLVAAPYLVWMAIFIVIPLGIVVYYAFTDSYTGAFTLNNIIGLGDYLHIFGFSILLGAIAAVICLFIGYPMAYAIAQAKERNQRFLVMLIMLPMVMSFLLRTLAWKSLLMDNGIINGFLGQFGIGPLPLIRNAGAVVLAMVYNFLPFMIMPLYTSLSKMDRRIIEAAEDLGATKIHVLRRIIFPLSVPGIISGVTMVFVPAVSTFYISKQLGAADMLMVGDVIESQFKTSYNPNFGAAMSLVLMVLILISMGVMNKFADGDSEEIIL